MLLPHESTVAHEQRFIMDEPMISRTRNVPTATGDIVELVSASKAATAATAAAASTIAATSAELSRMAANDGGFSLERNSDKVRWVSMFFCEFLFSDLKKVKGTEQLQLF